MNGALPLTPPAEPPPERIARRWMDDYAQLATKGDLMLSAAGGREDHWLRMLAGLAAHAGGDLNTLETQVGHEAADIGMAFRLPDEAEERPWPLCSVPLVLCEAEWRVIEAAMVQRAELLEAIVADIHGPQRLVSDDALPAAAITGSTSFWRQLIGVEPPGGRHLNFIAVDLGRDPDGEWRVLADHTTTPAGAGYALENRIALSRATGDLYAETNVLRLAQFFSDFREGLALGSPRVSPRIGLLTPGRFNPSYPEQAHLARYLGFLLVEGADLDVRDGSCFVRTIEGLKRIDVLWRRLDTRFLDPLAFDVSSHIGAPGLFDAYLAGNIVLANSPGAGILEAPALGAFLPRLSRHVLSENLKIPNIATWWCGQAAERKTVLSRLGDMVIEPAFNGQRPAGLEGGAALGSRLTQEGREALIAAMALRPEDYVGREVVKLSTTPGFNGSYLEPRPFTMRIFLARDGKGEWRMMPGGFARLSNGGDVRAAVMGEGAFSADVCVMADEPVEPMSLIQDAAGTQVRRLSGVLPSRAADSLYWLGRYVERGKNTTRVIRALLGGSPVADATTRNPAAAHLLIEMLVAWGAASDAWRAAEGRMTPRQVAQIALEDPEEVGSGRAVAEAIHATGAGVRDRLSPDLWRLIDNLYDPVRDQYGSLVDRTVRLMDRFAALGGMAGEYMVRGPGWRFYDLGRRVERGVTTARMVRTFAGEEASAEHLSILLDLADNQVTYRSRYQMGIARDPVRDLVALDPLNPRSLSFQTDAILDHVRHLPTLRDDGMPEEPQELATRLSAMVTTIHAADLDADHLFEVEARFKRLSDAIGRRFFLQGAVDTAAKSVTRLA